MPHERPERMGPSQQQAPKGSLILSKINSDIRALNSSILIISQKMRYLVRNEKILGRNLLVLNKKLKEIENSFGQGPALTGAMGEQSQSAHLSSNKAMQDLSNEVAELRERIEDLSQNYAKSEDVKEIKYIIDAIDPIQFVTRKDVEEMFGLRPKAEKEKAKKTKR